MADEGKTELKIDFRLQGVPHVAVQQEDDRIREIRWPVRQVKNHQNKDALFADLQKTCTYDPFREESEKIIQNMGERGMLRTVRNFLVGLA